MKIDNAESAISSQSAAVGCHQSDTRACFSMYTFCCPPKSDLVSRISVRGWHGRRYGGGRSAGAAARLILRHVQGDPSMSHITSTPGTTAVLCAPAGRNRVSDSSGRNVKFRLLAHREQEMGHERNIAVERVEPRDAGTLGLVEHITRDQHDNTVAPRPDRRPSPRRCSRPPDSCGRVTRPRRRPASGYAESRSARWSWPAPARRRPAWCG